MFFFLLEKENEQDVLQTLNGMGTLITQASLGLESEWVESEWYLAASRLGMHIMQL